LALEKAERARDDDVAAESVPPESAEEEGTQVLDDLNAGQQMRRHCRLLDATVFDERSVDDANGTAAGNDISGVKERTDHALQSVSFDERVGVHRADELTASEAQTDVQRVSFAAVLLVDDDESRIRRRPVKRTDGLRRDVPLVNRLHGNEIELLDQYVHGSILG